MRIGGFLLWIERSGILIWRMLQMANVLEPPLSIPPYETMREDDSKAATPKHCPPPQVLQCQLDLHNHHNPGIFIFCHPYHHRHQSSVILDFGLLRFIAAYGRGILFSSVVKEPGITKAPDDSSLCVDTFWQYPLCC